MVADHADQLIYSGMRSACGNKLPKNALPMFLMFLLPVILDLPVLPSSLSLQVSQWHSFLGTELPHLTHLYL